MKNAAPTSSPIAKEPDPELRALNNNHEAPYINFKYPLNNKPWTVIYLNVVNRSGLALPNAKKVTPALIEYFSDKEIEHYFNIELTKLSDKCSKEAMV
jgi:hypothetical protein